MPRSATRSSTRSTGASRRTANSRTTGASWSSSTPSTAADRSRPPPLARAEPLPRVGRAPHQELAQLAEALAPEPGQVDHRAERVQRLRGADVVGRFLAADVLLARLQCQHEAATPVDILSFPGDPSRHA